MRTMPRFLVFVLALLSFGCAVGPNYHRPALQQPLAFRGAPAGSPSVDSIADTKWPAVFNDQQLNVLLATALADNYDLRIAAARVLQARAQYGIARSNIFPTLTGSANNTTLRQSSVGSIIFVPSGTNLDVNSTSAGFNLSWELDVWGRLRRLNEVARAQYVATEEGRRAVITTLIGDITNNYFYLLESDSELAISRRTLEVAQRSLDLTQIRRQGGVATSLDVRQAEQFLYTATATIAAAERNIEQFENLLSLLAAKNPGPIARGKTLTDFTAPPTVPPGLPSTLIERRPDIRQAEQQLIAANANIGAAKALYFPQITLTGLLGTQSRALTGLFTRPSENFSIAPDATIPIFNAGRIRNGVRYSEAQQQEALSVYQKSVNTALREVSDALVAYNRTTQQRAQEELLVKALEDTQRLSDIRYRGGIDSYLQVLDAERNLFTGQLDLARLRRDELSAIVNLYRALGGGWQ